ncbi:hypothetical protein [Paenibacillus elgii]|uniref:hypothetical protein n=1 Tax=Paenibacillus elgii TaxID=189691 RepID=UPI0002F9BD4D|nr:hypothetical protein [Paenibacillus elgii]
MLTPRHIRQLEATQNDLNDIMQELDPESSVYLVIDDIWERIEGLVFMAEQSKAESGGSNGA